MEIEEVKRKKLDLQKEIAALLKSFTDETGLEIFTLWIDETIYDTSLKSPGVHAYDVRIDVTL